MRATHSQPVTPVNGNSMCAKCLYSTTMNKQSRMYYNAGALKLDQARVLNKKLCKKLKEFATSARNRERVTAGKENVQPSGTQNFTPDRKAAIRARQALQKQLNCKKI